MSGISRNLNGPYARGVPNPYTAHVHPYPTRFHGAIYTRPVFGMPYKRRPFSVFKPDDFYSYYGVSGLGSTGGFAGSSLGNGTVGGNTLGLGATGSPIYWHGFNTKTKDLQGGVNKVLVANGYGEIGVDGKLGAKTCAAVGVANQFPAELRTQVPDEILQEAAKICMQVTKQYPTVKVQIENYVKEIAANRNVVPPEPLVSPTEVVPPTRAPVVAPPAPPPPPPPTAPPVPAVVQPQIEQPFQAIPQAPPAKAAIPTATPSQTIIIPDMEIQAAAPEQEHSGSNKLVLGLAALAVAGAGYYFWKKK